MSAGLRKVTFEHVSAIVHPEYYSGDRPRVRPEDVPGEHWSLIERQGEGVEGQFAGLRQLMASGELIRDVHLYEADAPAEPQWRELFTEPPPPASRVIDTGGTGYHED